MAKMKLLDRVKNWIAYIFIILFVYTAAIKLRDILMFKVFFKHLNFSPMMVTVFAYSIPLIQILISFVLIFPQTRQNGLKLSAVLILFYTSALLFMKINNSHLPCSCSGISPLLTWTNQILLNIGLFFLATSTFMFKKEQS